jgi:hypothetical protein
MNSFKPLVGDASSLSAFDASMKMWQDVIVTGGEWKNGYMTSEASINLVDTKTNALKQLNQYIDQMASAAQKRSVMTDEMMMDSTIAAPPAVEAPRN